MEDEFQDIDRRSAWSLMYQQIRNESSNYNYTYKDAKRVENKNLNRYRDVNPYDHSRVRLQRGDKDYINASLVSVPAANRSYILTQGPLPGTTGHFWLMIWEQKSKAVLMLNRIIEKNTVKCHQYWPMGSKNGGEDEITLTDVGLKVTYLDQREASYYTVRELLLSDLESGQSQVVSQFHYTTWPDFGVPESPAAFLNFLLAVRESGALSPNVGPAVVHCSAGIGRSGTFCLVDSCLVLIDGSGDMNSVNIRELLLDMRRYRMGLIQTPDQLRFSYVAIIEGAKKILAEKLTDKIVPLDTVKHIQPEKLQNTLHEDNLEESENSNAEHSEEETIELVNSEGSEEGVSKSMNDSSGDTEPPPPLPPRTVRRSEDISPTSAELISYLNSQGEPNCSENIVNNSIENSNNKYSNNERVKNNATQVSTSSNNICNSGAVGEPMNTTIGQDLVHHSDASSENRICKDSFLSNQERSSGIVNTVEQESATELRNRKRKERLEKTAAIVQKIKQKQRESEIWARRRSLIKRISLGLVLLLGTGVLVYRYYSKG